MTIPMMVAILSGVCWLLLEVALRPTNDDKSPAYPEFWAWATEVCRILFAVSTLATLLGYMNRSAF
jgi:hypothetical protein